MVVVSLLHRRQPDEYVVREELRFVRETLEKL